MTRWTPGSMHQSNSKSGEWSDREELGLVSDSLMICWSRDGPDQSKSKPCQWSGREDLGLGRSLNPLAVVDEQAREQAWHLPHASIHVWRVQ
jgi:hypothetical protein